MRSRRPAAREAAEAEADAVRLAMLVLCVKRVSAQSPRLVSPGRSSRLCSRLCSPGVVPDFDLDVRMLRRARVAAAQRRSFLKYVPLYMVARSTCNWICRAPLWHQVIGFKRYSDLMPRPCHWLAAFTREGVEACLGFHMVMALKYVHAVLFS